MIIEDEIYLLKKIKKNNPFDGNEHSKYNKFEKLLVGLCEIHKIGVPEFVINKNLPKGVCGDCRFESPRIRLKRFSVVTLLHEFKHWVDYSKKLNFDQELDDREWDAIYYSNILFYAVWPERIKNLKEVKELARKQNIVHYFNEYINKNPSVQAIIDLCLKQ